MWAFGGSLKALASLPRIADALDLPVALAILGLLVTAAAWLVIRRDAWGRITRQWPWLAWGGGWFLLACASIAPIHPIWAPNRAVFGAIGLGVAMAALLGAAHPALAGVLVAGRLLLLFLAPPAATTISREPPDTGAFMDFQHLTRLQRFMRGTRVALRTRYPRMPGHAWVAQDNLPLGLTYALGGDKAVRAWYRDSTLRWVVFGELRQHPEIPVITVVNYQPDISPEIVLLSPAATLAQDSGYVAIQAGRFDDAIAAFDRGDALETNPDARLFHATGRGLRGFAALSLGRLEWARADAESALVFDPHETNSRRVLANLLMLDARLDEAQRQLDTLLTEAPGDSGVQRVREQLLERRRAGAFGRSPRAADKP